MSEPAKPSPRIRVAVVEDDPMQLELVSRTLRAEPDLDVIGTYPAGRTAVAALAAMQPPAHVVIVDLGLPDIGGSEVTRQVRAFPNPPEVVVLTAHGDRAKAIEALKAGATGYLLKGPPSELPAAIRVAAQGGSTIAPAIARYLLDEIRVPAPSGGATGMRLREIGQLPDTDEGAEGKRPEGEAAHAAGPALTRREREVLALLAKGSTYEDAARMLGISLGTVQSHVKRLYRKLEVSSKAEAAAEAVRRGLAWP